MGNKEIKLLKAKCIKCKHAIMIESNLNVYCPKLIDACGKYCGAGGFMMIPIRCKFYEVNKSEK